MKFLTFKSAIAVLTFIISIGTVTFWLNKSSNDPTVYSVKLCDLIKNSNQYDGKMVRIQVYFYRGVERLNLGDSECSEYLRATYSPWDENAKRISQQINEINLPVKPKIDVIGKFNAKVTDPDPPDNGSFFPRKIHLFEIRELEGIEAIKNQ